MLTDLCNVSGPWSKVLRTLRDELVRSVYSDYYAMEQQGLQFSQLPYFKAAERLEADNQHLLHEKDAFKKVLLRRQVLVCISAQLRVIFMHFALTLQAACLHTQSNARATAAIILLSLRQESISAGLAHVVNNICA